MIIKDNIVERSAGFGIAVGFDPFWCCPSALFYQAAVSSGKQSVWSV